MNVTLDGKRMDTLNNLKKKDDDSFSFLSLFLLGEDG